MFQRTRRSFFAGVIISALCLPSIGISTVSAAATGLVKGSTAAVYYASASGDRYAFPNEKTYRTWYADFSQVQTISDQELARMPLRANVTYRPGVRLVKITTDPKSVCRVVVRLRWAQTEAIVEPCMVRTGRLGG